MAILVYRMVVQHFVPEYRDRLFTVILLITPLVLYFTLSRLLVMHWNYRLSFALVMMAGMFSVLVTGAGIAILDYLILRFDIPVLNHQEGKVFTGPFIRFLLAYLIWYALLGLVSTPVVYLLLYFKLKKHRK